MHSNISVHKCVYNPPPLMFIIYMCVSMYVQQMRHAASSKESWCTAWQASVALSPSPWPTSCHASPCASTRHTISSRSASPTSHPTSRSWVSCWTLRRLCRATVSVGHTEGLPRPLTFRVWSVLGTDMLTLPTLLWRSAQFEAGWVRKDVGRAHKQLKLIKAVS